MNRTKKEVSDESEEKVKVVIDSFRKPWCFFTNALRCQWPAPQTAADTAVFGPSSCVGTLVHFGPGHLSVQPFR